MKKGRLLNARLSSCIAEMGHTDGLVICDAGLPVPSGPERLDLALTKGVPGLLQTLEVVLEELEVEELVLATEMNQVSPELRAAVLERVSRSRAAGGRDLRVLEVSHEELKRLAASAKAVVRTGECTPYANLILRSGVTF